MMKIFLSEKFNLKYSTLLLYYNRYTIVSKTFVYQNVCIFNSKNKKTGIDGKYSNKYNYYY